MSEINQFYVDFFFFLLKLVIPLQLFCLLNFIWIILLHKENVFWSDITDKDPMLVELVNSLEKLICYDLCVMLWECPVKLDVIRYLSV